MRSCGPLLVACFVIATSLAACGTTSTPMTWDAGAVARVDAAASAFALIVATDGYELHLRAGRVYVVEPGAAPARQPVAREVRSYARFRDLYSKADAGALPSAEPSDGVLVTGWRDLECVRLGHVCGRQPEPGGRGDAVRLKIVFPN